MVSRAWEVEKAWLKDEARGMAIMAAIQRFEGHPSVERRGKVSKQNRYEPAGVLRAHISDDMLFIETLIGWLGAHSMVLS